jgi:ABC-type phosphate transport system permease subunit
MRPNSAVGLLLIVLGCLALFVRSVTYFTTEQVAGPLGFFAWDVNQPHTIFINPIAGLIAVAIGAALLAAPGRRAAA